MNDIQLNKMRTKIGIGGVKLFDIPGVIYPDNMLHADKGCNKRTGKEFKTAPAWGITSKEAAEILGCSISAARITMYHHKVLYRIVRDAQTRRIYWNRKQVERLKAARKPTIDKAPEGYITTAETMRLLGVSRSSLQRYHQRGKLIGKTFRYTTPRLGARTRTYFPEVEVRKYARVTRARKHMMQQAEKQIATMEGGEA